MPLPDYASIRQVADAARDGSQRACGAYGSGQVQAEPEFAQRMLVEIERSIEGVEINGLRWRAATLTSMRPRSQERRIGADFLGVVRISLADFRVAKGFLGQAKLLDDRGELGLREIRRLRRQCRNMLDFTPDAFVFLLSDWEVRVTPAISVLGANEDVEPLTLYHHGVRTFFENHLTCFIGDGRFEMADARRLDLVETRRRYRPSHILSVSAGLEPGEWQEYLSRFDEYEQVG